MGGQFKLGDWRVDPQLGLISSGDVTRRLKPLAMKLLTVLAERPGEVLGKEQILRRVWGEEVFVNENALSHVVWELRQALGDRARRSRYIETLPKRGYRLLVDVEPISHPLPNHAGSGTTATQWRPRGGFGVWILGAALALVMGVWALKGSTRSEPAAPLTGERDDLHRIARLELDFEISGDTDEGYVGSFRALLADQLLLAGLEVGFGAITPGSHVLEGRFVDGFEAEFVGHLVHRSTGQLVFSIASDLPDDLEASDLAEAVASELEAYAALDGTGFFDDPELEPWASIGRHDVHALLAFAQGVNYTYRNEVGAAPFFAEAAEKDPDFVAPRVWLTPSLLGAGEMAAVDAHFDRLAELESDASPFERAMIGYARALREGDTALGIRHLEVAESLAPRNKIVLVNLGLQRYALGDYEGALEALTEPVESWDYPGSFATAARAALELDQVDRAAEILARGLATDLVDPEVLALAELLAVLRGDEESAKRHRVDLELRLREMHPEQVEIDLRGLRERLVGLARE